MRPDLIEAFRAAVEKAGLNLIIDPEDCWADAQDRAGRGVAIITSHPVSMDANPLKEQSGPDGRSLPGRMSKPVVHYGWEFLTAMLRTNGMQRRKQRLC